MVLGSGSALRVSRHIEERGRQMSNYEKMDGYDRGQVDALELWGRVCSGKERCEKCAIGVAKSAGMTCQEFASKFPEKFLSLLSEMDKGYTTYLEEYTRRFPDAHNSLDTLIGMGMCRKAIFEGYLLCEVDNSLDGSKSVCEACWNERYMADISLTPEEREQYERQLEELGRQAMEEESDLFE